MLAVGFNRGTHSSNHEWSHASYSSVVFSRNFSAPKSLVKLYGGSAKSKSNRAAGSRSSRSNALPHMSVFLAPSRSGCDTRLISRDLYRLASISVISIVRFRGARAFDGPAGTGIRGWERLCRNQLDRGKQFVNQNVSDKVKREFRRNRSVSQHCAIVLGCCGRDLSLRVFIACGCGRSRLVKRKRIKFLLVKKRTVDVKFGESREPCRGGISRTSNLTAPRRVWCFWVRLPTSNLKSVPGVPSDRPRTDKL